MPRKRTVKSSGAAALIAVAILVAPSPTLAKKQPLVGTDYGPEPDWSEYKALGEAAIRARLVDPDSARFSWPNGYGKGGYTPFLSRRIYGYSTCGYVNSRNRMGGYAGDAAFVVVIDRGQVLYTEVSSSPNGLLVASCAKTAFPSPDSMPQQAAAPVMGYGFSLSPVQDGAYVSTVSPGSTAQTAGLKPGMVVAELNGVSVRGMALTTINQLLAATNGSVTLTIIGGASLRIAKDPTAPPPPPAPLSEDNA